MQMMTAGEHLVYECLRCTHQWPERRTSHVAHDHPALAGEHAHLAVEAICSATGLEQLMASTLAGARRLTGADGVTLIWQSDNHCWCLDDDTTSTPHARRTRRADAVAAWLTRARMPAIVSDITNDAVSLRDSCLPPSARSLVIVPVRAEEPVGTLVAWWRNARTLPATHVQMLELLAEAMRLGIARHQLGARIREAIDCP
jgi:GAF domain-containing protein